MGEFYSGFGYTRTFLGSCENGQIYKGSGIYRETIGSYSNGSVYRGYGFGGDLVGTYENGSVYTVPCYTGTGFSSELVGTYDSDTIYIKSGLFGQSVGSYSGDGAEAAALLLLMPEELPSYAQDEPAASDGYAGSTGGSYTGGDSSGGSYTGTGSHISTGTGAYSDSRSVSGGSSIDPGIFGAILGVIGFVVLLFLFGLIWYAIYQSVTDDPDDLLYLAIFLFAIILGLFFGAVVFKIRDMGGLYLTTVIIASVINIIASAVLDPGNVTFLRLLVAPPLVTALAAALPTGMVCVGASLIDKAKEKATAKRTKKQAG